MILVNKVFYNFNTFFKLILNLFTSDTTDHHAFLAQLRQENVMYGDAVDWMVLYLTHRSQCIYVNETMSDNINIASQKYFYDVHCSTR